LLVRRAHLFLPDGSPADGEDGDGGGEDQGVCGGEHKPKKPGRRGLELA
jgi:hypothetical protein